MSTKLKHQGQEQKQGGGDNVTALGSAKCCYDGCSKKSELTNFCREHYDWFKFGLITKDGKKPVDFDRKFQAYQRRKAAA